MAAVISSASYRTNKQIRGLASSYPQHLASSSPVERYHESNQYSLSSNRNGDSSRNSNQLCLVEISSLSSVHNPLSSDSQRNIPSSFLKYPHSSEHLFRSKVICNPLESTRSLTDNQLGAKSERNQVINSPVKTRHSFRNIRRSMGSSSSVVKESGHKKPSKKARVDSTDNGGFDCEPAKPTLGVKEKLRYSLEKLSLKGPFRWNSSDKLIHNATKGSKSKNNRRYSDSSSLFLTTDCKAADGRYSEQRKTSDDSSDLRKITAGVSRMVRAYPAVRSDSLESEVSFGIQTDMANNHDYVNLQNTTKSLKVNSSSRTKYWHDSSYDVSRTENDYSSRQSNDYQGMASLPRLQALQTNDSCSRAKGTWKMFEVAKSNQNLAKEESNLEEFQNHLDGYVFPFIDEVSSEPPRLAPVSGKLLMSKNSENIILKPTAFRPNVIYSSNNESPLSLHVPDQSAWRQSATAKTPVQVQHSGVQERRENGSSSSNNSDSGRHSATSIPAAVTVTSSFSCSGSEGYESARVPSSTNQSTAYDHENTIDTSSVFSPRKLSVDGSTLIGYKSADAQKRDEVKKVLETSPKSCDDSQVVDEIACANNPESVKMKTTSQMKLQRRSSVHERQAAEQQYRRLHEEQQQLHDANNELEERIKSMTEAIDAQSKINNDIEDLKSRLEENEMEMKQQRDEISLLKHQIKEKQKELSHRSYELLVLKTCNRDYASEISQRKAENQSLYAQISDQQQQIFELERHVTTASSRQVLPVLNTRDFPVSKSVNEFRNDGKRFLMRSETYSDQISALPYASNPSIESSIIEEKRLPYEQLQATENQLAVREEEFETEKQQWIEDKNKVVKYQKLLQENYVKMYKRSYALERQVETLNAQLRRAGLKSESIISLSGSENEERPSLSFPMEI